MLQGLPNFADGAGEARIVRLGGQTNQVFRIDLGAEAYCLRLPGPGTENYVDRPAEAANAGIAAAAGRAPDLIYASRDGTMVTRFVGDALPMSPEMLRHGTAAERVGRALRALHDDTPAFRNSFVLSDYLDRYCRELAKADPQALSRLEPDLKRAGAAVQALAARPPALKPCHCDLQPENLLDTGGRIWLIDWEFSGQNDPFWDLGYLSLEAGFDPGTERRVVDAYLGRPPSRAEFSRLAVYKTLADLLAIMWGLLPRAWQGSRAELANDLERRTERFRLATGNSEFLAHLMVLGGP